MPEQDIIPVLEEDGSVVVYARLSADAAEKLENIKAINGKKNGNSSEELEEVEAASTWNEGTFYFPNYSAPAESYRSPRLSVPNDYYTRVHWSNEYYEQESLVHALINRDIDQAITDEEFHLPEEQEGPRTALDKWSREVNRGMGQYGGLGEYNRSLMLDLVLSSLSVTLANWGPILVKNKVYTVPKALVNLDPLCLIPDIDTFSGRRKYYYILSPDQYDAINKRRKNSISEIIPDARSRLRTSIEFLADKYIRMGHPQIAKMVRNGYFLELPMENTYVINIRGRQQDRWPTPTLVPIFTALAMKRKLALADWSVADGMVNMIMVWKFPPTTKPEKAKAIVQKFMTGGRVQSHAVPVGVEVELITPDATILNSSEKFWQPTSEILAHFGYPLNSKSRGAGDLDSGPLDLSSNRARIQFWRTTIQDHNNFWIEKIAERNNWDFEVFSIFQTRDLDDDANFRTFASSAFDRGVISIETFHDLLKTSTEREAARRKREKREGLESLFAIRPSFSQTAGPATGGRPAAGSEKKPVGSGTDSQKGQSRSQRGRPSTSAQSESQQ